jgi:hypothetical protein
LAALPRDALAFSWTSRVFVDLPIAVVILAVAYFGLWSDPANAGHLAIGTGELTGLAFALQWQRQSFRRAVLTLVWRVFVDNPVAVVIDSVASLGSAGVLAFTYELVRRRIIRRLRLASVLAQSTIGVLGNRGCHYDCSALAACINGIIVDDSVAIIVNAITYLRSASASTRTLDCPVSADRLPRTAGR